MYSMVLMAAMTTGSTTPECHWRSSGCHGCYGGGCYSSYGCSGCYGGYGGYGGHGGYGGYMCYGAYSGYGGYYGGSGCSGCYGGWSCYGVSPYHPTPMIPGVAAPGAEQVPPPKQEKDNKDQTSTNRAQLIVELPADATLYIDGQQMKTSSGRRVFNTPALEPGQTYYYVLRAEVVRDGQRKMSEQRVVIRPGQEARAAFTNLGAAATATVQATDR